MYNIAIMNNGATLVLNFPTFYVFRIHLVFEDAIGRVKRVFIQENIR